MASIYKKSRSSYWYIQYLDTDGRRRNESTGLRWDDQAETRKARKLCAQRTVAECDVAPPHGRPSRNRSAPVVAGWGWALDYLDARYIAKEKTRIRMRGAWFAIEAFLKARQIRSPRSLKREDAVSYIPWRLSKEAQTFGLRAIKHNTALLEIKCLSCIMREAVNRDLAPANPCLQLGIGRVDTKVKPEILADEIEIIEAALKPLDWRYAEEMRRSWSIAMAQGCRLSETSIPLPDIDIAAMTITYRIKGGREHTQMLNPVLVPLIRKLREEGAARTFTLPPSFAKVWWNFFHDRVKLPHLSFHCTRVTAVTKLRDAGVDERLAMEFIGHRSVTVHRIYQRSKRSAQSAAVAALASLSGQNGSGNQG